MVICIQYIIMNCEEGRTLPSMSLKDKKDIIPLSGLGEICLSYCHPFCDAGVQSFDTLSLENHQDGVYLHRHGVTFSLQAILVCSYLPV